MFRAKSKPLFTKDCIVYIIIILKVVRLLEAVPVKKITGHDFQTMMVVMEFKCISSKNIHLLRKLAVRKRKGKKD